MNNESQSGAPLKQKRSLSQQSWGYIFALPAILGFVLFTAGPMLYSLYLSFTDVRLGIQGNFVGLANYIKGSVEKQLFQKNRKNY